MSSDVLFPLRPDLSLIKDEAVTIQNIQQLFYTRPMEHIYFPTMGVGLEDSMFESGDDIFKELQQPIVDQVRKYVPEFEETTINITREKSILYVTVIGKIVKYGINNIAFNFTIEQ